MKKFYSLFLGLMLVLTLSSCTLFGGDKQADNGDNTQNNNQQTKVDPKEVIKKMQTTMSEVKALAFDMNLGVKFDIEEQGSGNISLSMNGATDTSVETDPRMETDMNLTFSADMGEESVSGNVALSLMALEDNMYFNLGSISLTGAQVEGFTDMIDPYVGKWYSTPFEMTSSDFDFEMLSQAFMDGFNQGLTEGQELTEEQQAAVEQLVKDTEWFTVESDRGTDKVNGVETHVIDVILNEEGIKTFVSELAKIMEEELTDEDMEELDKSMESFELKATLYIGSKDYYLYKVNGTFEISPDESLTDQGGTITIDLEMTMSDFNETIDVTAPEDAELFDLTSMMYGGDDYMYDDTYDYEDYDMMDDSYMMDETTPSEQ